MSCKVIPTWHWRVVLLQMSGPRQVQFCCSPVQRPAPLAVATHIGSCRRRDRVVQFVCAWPFQGSWVTRLFCGSSGHFQALSLGTGSVHGHCKTADSLSAQAMTRCGPSSPCISQSKSRYLEERMYNSGSCLYILPHHGQWTDRPASSRENYFRQIIPEMTDSQKDEVRA